MESFHFPIAWAMLSIASQFSAFEWRTFISPLIKNFGEMKSFYQNLKITFFVYPNFSAIARTLTWVYRATNCNDLWPDTAAIWTGVNPRFPKRLHASWRKVCVQIPLPVSPARLMASRIDNFTTFPVIRKICGPSALLGKAWSNDTAAVKSGTCLAFWSLPLRNSMNRFSSQTSSHSKESTLPRRSAVLIKKAWKA